MPLSDVAPVFVPIYQPQSDPASSLDYVLVGDHQPAFVDYEASPGVGTRGDLDHAGQRVLHHVGDGQTGRQRFSESRL